MIKLIFIETFQYICSAIMDSTYWAPCLDLAQGKYVCACVCVCVCKTETEGFVFASKLMYQPNKAQDTRKVSNVMTDSQLLELKRTLSNLMFG